ncbi:MAG: hypothetical protein HY719_08730 [Planctomycetes bacterium]|nr:hypothetical protein [Planctomycetota bacterium]
MRRPHHLPPLRFALLGLALATAAAAVAATVSPLRAEEVFATRAWQIHSRRAANIDRALEAAPTYGVNQLQLSHNLIMDVDEINRSPTRQAQINSIVRRAHEKGLKVSVWAHELVVPGGKKVAAFDLDPDGGGKEFWAARRQAYRDFFSHCPDVDAIVLQFGSSQVEVWHVLPASDWNRANTGAARVKLTIDQVRAVVAGEFHRELIVRDFNHRPIEQQWLMEAFDGFKPGEITLMPKVVPQDWEPFYPHSPVFLRAGGKATVTEWDIAAEYCGQSAFPFVMIDEIRWRLDHQLQHGVTGYVLRVERGDQTILGTPNESNAYAFACFSRNSREDPGRVLLDWTAKTYGLDRNGPDAAALAGALRDTYDAVRKMYYVRGFWCLEKGSDVTTSGAAPALLDGRSLALWDPDYADWHAELKAPTPRVLDEIVHEKEEAKAIADRCLATARAIQARAANERLAALVKQFEHLRVCARVWRHLAESIFRHQLLKREPSDEQRAWLEGSLAELERLAAEIEQAHGPNFSPGNPRRIRAAVADIRKRLDPFAGEPRVRDLALITDVRVTTVTDQAATISWRAPWAARGFVVEYGKKRPLYGRRLAVRPDAANEGRYTATLEGLPADDVTFFRIAGRPDGQDAPYAITGDYWARTAR